MLGIQRERRVSSSRRKGRGPGVLLWGLEEVSPARGLGLGGLS